MAESPDTPPNTQMPRPRLTWSANDTGHRELDVMMMLDNVLGGLPEDERRRVLAWANDRFRGRDG